MMSSKTIRWLVLFSALSITGVVITQIYWIRKVLDIRDREFSQQVHVALQEVAEELSKVSNVMLFNNPVEQLGPDYFLVNTNARTQPDILEHFLKDAFTKHNLITDFEVGIYDCNTNRMQYGMSLSTRNDSKSSAVTTNWVMSDKYPYYFGVHFPERKSFFPGELQGWMWSSIINLIALGFFAYALFVILRQKQLSEVQRDFINNMTHELQTPISSIKLAADVLAKPAILTQPERYNRYVSIIGEEIGRLQKQVETVLTTAKSEQNKLALERTTIEVHEALSHILLKYDTRIKQDFQASKTNVECDMLHFNALIVNLVDNALKYSAKETDVIVATWNTKNKLYIAIKDQGIGISAAHQRKIFKKFYRVPMGDVHNVKGFGIGLSYVKEIAKAHQWQLEVISEPGKGSEFRVGIKMA